MGTYRMRQRLPTAYNTELGRVVMRFAILENILRGLTYSLLEVNPKFGRIAVRSPRIQDSTAMIQDFMSLHGFSSRLDLKELLKGARVLEEFRDRISHGVW